METLEDLNAINSDAFKGRLGELMAAHDKGAAALEVFLAALADHASNGRARRGLRGLLEQPALAAAALGGLVEACERSDDWQERLQLVEFRLQATEDLAGTLDDGRRHAG